jgi:hypothetical protein
MKNKSLELKTISVKLSIILLATLLLELISFRIFGWKDIDNNKKNYKNYL